MKIIIAFIILTLAVNLFSGVVIPETKKPGIKAGVITEMEAPQNSPDTVYLVVNPVVLETGQWEREFLRVGLASVFIIAGSFLMYQLINTNTEAHY